MLRSHNKATKGILIEPCNESRCETLLDLRGFFNLKIMYYQVLRIDDEVTETSVECFINTQGRIVLKRPDDNEDGNNYFIISMGKEEALELAKELKRLSKLL